MRAGVVVAAGAQVEIVNDVDIDQPLSGEVLVEVRACGLCHSDLNIVDGLRSIPFPLIAGHEVAGIVAAVGPGVSQPCVGDAVVLTLRPACGTCRTCAAGRPQLCPTLGARNGVFPDGGTRLTWRGRTVFRGVSIAGFAQYVITPAQGAVVVPAHVPPEVACILGCGVQTGFGAVVSTAKVGPGATVLVVGLGAVGLAAAQAAQICGAAQVIGVDSAGERRAFAQRYPWLQVVDAVPAQLADLTRDLTDGQGVDFAFDAVGSAGITEALMPAVCEGGTVVMVGAQAPGDTVTVSASDMFLGERTLKGSFLGSSHAPRDFARMIAFWQAGVLDLDGMVTATRPLRELQSAFDDLRAHRGIRTVIVPD